MGEGGPILTEMQRRLGKGRGGGVSSRPILVNSVQPPTELFSLFGEGGGTGRCVLCVCNYAFKKMF